MSDERSFDDVKSRLDEIADTISQEGISLDDALALYEEAVKLGIEACDLSEADILGDSEDGQAEQGANASVAPMPQGDLGEHEGQPSEGEVSVHAAVSAFDPDDREADAL